MNSGNRVNGNGRNGNKLFRPAWVDLAVLAAGGMLVFLVAGWLDAFEAILAFLQRHEEFELDEAFIVGGFYLPLAFAVYAFRRWMEQRRYQKTLERKNRELADALGQVRTMRGLVPICSSCKSIRDDKGYWQRVEAYVRDHTEAQFTHGLCPDCVKRLYGDLISDEQIEEAGRADTLKSR